MPTKQLKPAQDFVPAPPDSEEEIPDLRALVAQPADRLLILRKVTRLREIKDELSPLNKEEKKLVDEVKKLLGKHQIGACMVDDIKVRYWAGKPRKTLKADLLLLEGIPMATIDKCTVEGKPSYTLKVTRLGVEEEEEG